MKNIVIIGGGFAGIGCAIQLAKHNLPDTKIRLISDRKAFEYHAALYRVVTGTNPMEVVLSLRDIFERYPQVEVVYDRITSIDLHEKKICSDTKCDYGYDELVIAVGSQTIFYDTPGLEDLSFGFKTIDEALELKKHLQSVFKQCAINLDSNSKEDTLCDARFVVVGGGPSGTELAGELAIYCRKLAQANGIDPSYVSIDLIQSPNRVVPQGSEKLSARIDQRLRSLGVNIYLNRRLVKEEIEKVYLKDMEINAQTVIWTAGVSANTLYSDIPGLQLDKAGRVIVTPHLQAKGQPHVWIAGDGASVSDSGLGQAALFHGRHIADEIAARATKRTIDPYQPRDWMLAVPVGPGWAAVQLGQLHFYGKAGWFLRRFLDFFVYKQFLTWPRAWRAFQAGNVTWESGLE